MINRFRCRSGVAVNGKLAPQSGKWEQKNSPKTVRCGQRSHNFGKQENGCCVVEARGYNTPPQLGQNNSREISPARIKGHVREDVTMLLKTPRPFFHFRSLSLASSYPWVYLLLSLFSFFLCFFKRTLSSSLSSQDSMDSLRRRLERSKQMQTVLRAFEARDRNLLEDNLWRVSFWSCASVLVMLCVALTQVRVHAPPPNLRRSDGAISPPGRSTPSGGCLTTSGGSIRKCWFAKGKPAQQHKISFISTIFVPLFNVERPQA